MNSIQINFFITPEDWQTIEIFLERNNIEILHDPIIKKQNCILRDTSKLEKLPSQIYLTHKNFENNIELSHIQEIGNYFIDVSKSPVVEFDKRRL